MSTPDLTAVTTALFEDALEIYERARKEVFIERSDGSTQRYAATRYKQQINRGRSENSLVPTIANIVRKPTLGFSHLRHAGRPDLMLETLVTDESKPSNHLFSRTTIEVAGKRLDEYKARTA